MLFTTLLMLMMSSWTESDAVMSDKMKMSPEEYCRSNVTGKAGMTASLYCCLGVWNKGAEVSSDYHILTNNSLCLSVS